MRIEQLLYLQDLGETHSITETAQHFYLTQQAISNSIKTLEKEYNATFLERSRQGVLLTPAGEAFLRSAQKLIHAYDDLNDEFAQFTTQSEPSEAPDIVTIYSHSRLMDTILIDIIEECSITHPAISLNIHEDSLFPTCAAILNDEVNIGLSISHLEPDKLMQIIDAQFEQQIACTILYTDSYVACCKKTHPLTEYQSVTWDMISGHAKVSFGNTHPYYNNEQSDLINNFQNHYFSQNLSFHKSLIKRGLAVGLISPFEFRKLYRKHPYLTAISIDNFIPFQIVLLHKKDAAQKPAVKKILSLLNNYSFYEK